jgi:signal transduction histidine kinase
MRRKTIIVLAITLLVTVMAAAFSYLYISEILADQINEAYEGADRLTKQLAYSAGADLPDLSSTRVDTNNPEAVRRALAEYLPMDTILLNGLQSDRDYWPYIYDVSIVDANGKVLLHTNPQSVGKQAVQRPDFIVVKKAKSRKQLRIVYNPATVYDVSSPLLLNGLPFGSIRIGVSTLFLRSEIEPRLLRAVYFSIASIFASLLLAAGVSNLALGPLKEISRNLDSVSSGATDLSGDESEHDELGLVTLKIANLGRQMRDSREIFSALKDNVDQLMSKLQDGLMLFTRDSRVVLVSAPVERFLGIPRGELLGRAVKDVFFGDSALGSAVREAFERRRPLSGEFIAAAGRHVQVSLDFVHEHEKDTQIGALLIMRDAESVRRIGDEIEMSRRLSASGRVTGGVAHEVKNPINAIVLHLQLLQNKLSLLDPDTRRHMDIIGSEIHRLDRVVQTLVDFMRARELHLEEIDFRDLLDEVAGLAAPDAEQHGVTVARDISDAPLPVKADLDFIKQALLNVVINGIQAMPQGGVLTISAHREENFAIAEIRDQGMGIPQDVQDKIFELYFTTKKDGNGIGLAQTYQIMQWHYGSVEFNSVEGAGTTFRFRLPLSASALDSEPETAAHSEM